MNESDQLLILSVHLFVCLCFDNRSSRGLLSYVWLVTKHALPILLHFSNFCAIVVVLGFEKWRNQRTRFEWMMGSQSIGGRNGVGKQLQLLPLVRQNSVYSLTLDEVQTQLGDLGKPLSSMNLNELLNSICTAEANQSLGVDVENIGLNDQFPLQPQRSLSLTGALSKKTVDEVWRDIQRGQSSNIETTMREKQPTLGEMTLEDFLVKAGVVGEESLEKGNENPVIESVAIPQFLQPGQWMSFSQTNLQHPPENMIPAYMQGQPMPPPMPMPAISMMDVTYGDNQVALQSAVMGALSDTQSGRKRIGQQEPVDKSAERRQKRMIKNRESAARSRARKQAYTNELENKVSRLEEENERLRKRKELENLLSFVSAPEPRYQLRRTSSASF